VEGGSRLESEGASLISFSWLKKRGMGCKRKTNLEIKGVVGGKKGYLLGSKKTMSLPI